jgi:hypothetical protein
MSRESSASFIEEGDNGAPLMYIEVILKPDPKDREEMDSIGRPGNYLHVNPVKNISCNESTR